MEWNRGRVEFFNFINKKKLPFSGNGILLKGSQEYNIMLEQLKILLHHLVFLRLHYVNAPVFHHF